jgi:hypothetical protein
MHSLSTTLGAEVYMTTPESFAVSGLRIQALVSGLLHSKIQRLTATNGTRAAQSVKDSSSSLLRDHVLLDPVYTTTNRSTDVRGHAP